MLRHHLDKVLRAADLPHKHFGHANQGTKRGASSLSPALKAAICKSLKKHQKDARSLRSLHEPLCIAFGTSFASPRAPTYQLYDLPKTVDVRLSMECYRMPIGCRSDAYPMPIGCLSDAYAYPMPFGC